LLNVFIAIQGILWLLAISNALISYLIEEMVTYKDDVHLRQIIKLMAKCLIMEMITDT